jgi:hypothetical protein
MSELTKAFIKFQAELKPVAKDMKNSYFNSKYATLAAVLDEVLPILTKHDLAIVQTFKHENNLLFLCTKLMHASGESVSSEMPMQNAGDVQKMGSQITYLKRYSLMAMLGVSTADEDDDGNAASKPKQFEKPRVDYKEKQNNVDKIKVELAKQTQGKSTEEKQRFLNDKLKVSSFKDVEKMNNDELINIYNKLSGIIK